MLGVADYGAFVVAILIFLMIPGPGNLALISATGKGGVRGGLAAALGLVIGHQCLLWLAVAGVAALLAAYPAALAALQWLGAAYLVWMGARMLRLRPGAAPLPDLKPHHELRQAFMVTLLNPKAVLFYMAFLPLFMGPARHPAALGVIAPTVAALAFLYYLTVVLLTQHLAERLRAKPVIGRSLHRMAGVLLIGFGLRLALSR